MSERLAGELAAGGIAVYAFETRPNLKDLASAALELRKRQPRLPLLTIGPRSLLDRFARRYPPLTDGTFEPTEDVGLKLEELLTAMRL